MVLIVYSFLNDTDRSMILKAEAQRCDGNRDSNAHSHSDSTINWHNKQAAAAAAAAAQPHFHLAFSF